MAASAGLWAKAVTSVVEYWLQEGRVDCMIDAVLKDAAVETQHQDQVFKYVKEALRESI